MDYSRILSTDFSPFRLHVLDVVVLLHEHHNYPFASERNCVRTAQLVWVTPTYMPNNIREAYRECADLQARTADRASPPRIIFREPPLMAAVIMAWATVRSTIYEETEIFIELLDRALMGQSVRHRSPQAATNRSDWRTSSLLRSHPSRRTRTKTRRSTGRSRHRHLMTRFAPRQRHLPPIMRWLRRQSTMRWWT